MEPHVVRLMERHHRPQGLLPCAPGRVHALLHGLGHPTRSEEHTSELQSQSNLVCRLLLEKKNYKTLPYIVLSLPLILNCNATQRALYPFPTRRSSDLDLYDIDKSGNGGVGSWSLMSYGSWNATTGRKGSSPAHLDAFMRSYMGWVTPQDRKSTRLNSSHSQISYAVFCLKKKTIKHFHISSCHYHLSSTATPPNEHYTLSLHDALPILTSTTSTSPGTVASAHGASCRTAHGTPPPAARAPPLRTWTRSCAPTWAGSPH